MVTTTTLMGIGFGMGGLCAPEINGRTAKNKKISKKRLKENLNAVS